MKQKAVPGQKIICLNRKASFNYFFIEIIEAGISLKGSEVKSLRDGKGSIADSYAVDNNGELFLINSHIPLYRQSSYNNHDPKGERKLLLNRKEINKLIGKINQDGLTVTDKEVIIRPSLLYFGYTYCPDICPYDVARNVEASDLLKKWGYDATPVFISIDPKRDTPDVLRDFIANMDQKLMGLTGSDAQIKAASQAYKTYYKVNETGDDYYLVDHSTFTYLVLPDLGFVDFLVVVFLMVLFLAVVLVGVFRKWR